MEYLIILGSNSVLQCVLIKTHTQRDQTGRHVSELKSGICCDILIISTKI